ERAPVDTGTVMWRRRSPSRSVRAAPLPPSLSSSWRQAPLAAAGSLRGMPLTRAVHRHGRRPSAGVALLADDLAPLRLIDAVLVAAPVAALGAAIGTILIGACGKRADERAGGGEQAGREQGGEPPARRMPRRQAFMNAGYLFHVGLLVRSVAA